MRIYIISTTVILLAVIVIISILNSDNNRTQTGINTSGKSKTLEEMLDILAECGLKLAKPLTVKDILESWNRSTIEAEGFPLVIYSLAMTDEKPPWRWRCRNLMLFDLECVEGDGNYKRIVDKIVDMSEGSLPIIDIKDHVDIEKKDIWISFKYNGKKMKIECKFNYDWFDDTILQKLNELLKDTDPNKIFIEYNTGGQDCIIGCVSKVNFNKLKAKKLKFKPLE